MRFSLRWLFGLVAFAALASASLVYASQPLTQVLGAILAFFLVCAVIGAAYSRASSAAFCGGFAIAGWVYVLTLWMPVVRLNKGPPLPTELVDRVLSIFYDVISKEVRAEPINGDLDGAYEVNGVPYIRRPHWAPFTSAGHSLAAFVVAIIGGGVGQFFYRRRGYGDS